MDREKLDRAKDIDRMCYLLDIIEHDCSNKGEHWNNLYYLCSLNNEFKKAIHKLISETKQRLQKELDEL